MARLIVSPSEDLQSYLGPSTGIKFVDQPFAKWLRSHKPRLYDEFQHFSRSEYSVSRLRERLFRVNDPARRLEYTPVDAHFTNAKTFVTNKWINNMPQLSSVSFEEITFPQLTSAGVHYLGRTRQEAHALPENVSLREKIWSSYTSEDFINPTTARRYSLFSRVQLSDSPDGGKVRAVFGADQSLFECERRIGQPLLEAVKQVSLNYQRNQFSYVYGFTLPQVKARIRYLNDYFRSSTAKTNPCFTEGDWSYFDGFVFSYEVDAAFDIIVQIFRGDLAAQRFLLQYKKVFANPRVIDEDKEYKLSDYIPSGSQFTNIVGAIINEIRIFRLVSAAGIPLDKAQALVHGDDLLISIAPEYAAEWFYFSIERYIRDHMRGTKMDPIRYSDRTTSLTFLGHYFDLSVSRNLEVVLPLCLFTERRMVTSDEESLIRVYSIWKDSGEQHSLLHTYIRMQAKRLNIRFEDIEYNSWWSNVLNI